MAEMVRARTCWARSSSECETTYASSNSSANFCCDGPCIGIPFWPPRPVALFSLCADSVAQQAEWTTTRAREHELFFPLFYLTVGLISPGQCGQLLASTCQRSLRSLGCFQAMQSNERTIGRTSSQTSFGPNWQPTKNQPSYQPSHAGHKSARSPKLQTNSPPPPRTWNPKRMLVTSGTCCGC